jgi:hypothetical protein
MHVRNFCVKHTENRADSTAERLSETARKERKGKEIK